MKYAIYYWLANVLPFAVLIGIMEVFNDTNPKGWFWAKSGEWSKTKFVNPYWEEHVNLPLPFIKYISRYHIVLFIYIVLPIQILVVMPSTSWIMNYHVFPQGAPVYKWVLSGLLLVSSIWVGILGVEDFFYFLTQSVFNWYEPHALRRVVLHKDFAWFKDWLPPICGLNIPGHWVFNPTAALILLYVRQRWIMQ